jgi:predicted peroxiredoxin
MKQYFEKVIPSIKKQLKEQVDRISDKATKIKVDKLSEMLCNVETIKVIKESHVLTILRYYDLIKELKQVNK